MSLSDGNGNKSDSCPKHPHVDVVHIDVPKPGAVGHASLNMPVCPPQGQVVGSVNDTELELRALSLRIPITSEPSRRAPEKSTPLRSPPHPCLSHPVFHLIPM
jgi:hypothetical protein